MSNFEWQHEDGEWDDTSSQPLPKPSKSKRYVIVGVGLILVLVMAVLVITWQVNQQLQRTETAVKTNILASHHLVQSAAASADSELLLSVLSGRLPSWTDAQQENLLANVMFDRAPWGLELIPSPINREPQLTIAPDLTEGELVFPLDYQFMTTSGVTETVVLSQTAVYRQGIRSWLLAPPDSAFWGDWQTTEGERLTLIYPERDTPWAEKLAVDLEQILQQICLDPDLPDCAEDAMYTIRFDSHPGSLADAAEWTNLYNDDPYLNLPAPTLFGLPADEAAYQAMVQAYGVPLATAVFTNLFGWECCRYPAIFQTITEYQLSKMGLMAWPITTGDHIQALQEGLDFIALTDYWRSYQSDESDSSNWFLYTAFDFIFRQYPDLSPVYLLTSMQERGDMAYWLGDGFNQTGYQLGSMPDLWQTLQTEWWQFAYTETLLAQEYEAPPIPLPAQDIVLACLSEAQFDLDTTMSLYRLDRKEDRWQELLSSNSFILFNPFLNDEGIIIQALDLDETNQWQTQIWPFAGQQTELSNENGMFFSLGQFDPTGRFVITFAGEDESAVPEPMLIDLDSCTETTCDMLALPGLPNWSPDGEHTLISNKNIFATDGMAFWRNDSMVIFDATQPPEHSGFWLGDAWGQLSVDKTEADIVGNGYSPFWLDNETVGFVRQSQETGDAEVVVQSITGGDLNTLVTLADIQAEAPDDALALANIRYVVTHPAQPNKLFVVALDALGQEAYVFMVDQMTGNIDLRIQSPIQPYHSLGFSPNGRWLVLTGYQDESIGGTSTFVVHDLESNDTQTYTSNQDGLMLSPLYDWSADGNWILFSVNDRVLSMVAPAYHYQLVQLHDQGYCTSMAWINR